jgi:GMP synthase (glutamine-hydrolysing)
MNTILIIQSRRRPEMLAAEQEEYARATEGVVKLIFKNSLDLTEPWDTPTSILGPAKAVIIGGSGELDFDGGRDEGHEVRLTSKAIVERLRPLLTYLFSHNVPTLGICYGHQIIGESERTRVLHDTAQNKIGTYPVTLTKAGLIDPLFSTLPPTFLAQYGHKDSLESSPAGATLLATGERCQTSALRYGERMYTVQFHPELTKKDVMWKLEHSPGYLPDGVSAESLVNDSPEASQLIPAFIRLFVQTSNPVG